MAAKDHFRRVVGMLHQYIHRPYAVDLRKILHGHLVAFKDFVVVVRVVKRQRKYALLLQIALVNSGERARDDNRTPHVSRAHRGMLAAGALSIILITDNHPALAARLVLTG